jgi:hypothetical protein
MANKNKYVEPETVALPKKIYYTFESWRGVMQVCKCVTCGAFRNGEDEMIEHVLLHAPVEERESLLTQLIGDKK